MFTAIFGVLAAVVAKEHLGGAFAFTEILLGLSFGSLAGGFLSLRVHFRRPLLAGSALTAFLGVPTALLAVGAPALVIACGTFLAAPEHGVNSLWETALQRHVAPAALSRVSAYDWFGSLAFQPLGLAIAGPLAAAQVQAGARAGRDSRHRGGVNAAIRRHAGRVAVCLLIASMTCGTA